MIKKLVVKRRGHKENFDERKVYASCYAACLSTRMKVKKAEKICEKVSFQIRTYVKKKGRISSDEIFSKMFHVIHKIDEDAAFMYKTHRDVS